MTIKYTIVVEGADSDDPLSQGSTKPREGLKAVETVLNRLASGGKNVTYSVRALAAATKATGTVTFATCLSGDTVTIGGLLLTAVSTGATGPQFNTNANNTTAATAFATIVNANATLSPAIIASNTSAIVTLTCLIPGKIGNNITLASSGSTVAVSGTTLTSGAETAISWSF